MSEFIWSVAVVFLQDCILMWHWHKFKIIVNSTTKFLQLSVILDFDWRILNIAIPTMDSFVKQMLVDLNLHSLQDHFVNQNIDSEVLFDLSERANTLHRS